MHWIPSKYSPQFTIKGNINDAGLVIEYATGYAEIPLSNEKSQQVKNFMSDLRTDWLSAIEYINDEIDAYNSTLFDFVLPVVIKARNAEIAKRSQNDDLNNF